MEGEASSPGFHKLKAHTALEAIREIEAIRGRPLAHEQFDADEPFVFEDGILDEQKDDS